MRGRAESDDLVQETFLRALKARDTFELRSFGIRPWLFRILHNLYLNRIQRDQRAPKPIEDEHLDGLSAVDTTDIKFDDDGKLDAAMADLSPDLRSILILWAVDELSYKQMSHVLDIPVGTVMSRLHRARIKLKERLADHPMARRAQTVQEIAATDTPS
ncbi:MAG: RNA polymerase sigma factor [Tepidisphaeraceae bacterium]